jgi:hypothetical protein
MTVRLVAGALVVGLDDDGLASGVAASQDQDDFTSFHNLTHVGEKFLKNQDF